MDDLLKPPDPARGPLEKQAFFATLVMHSDIRSATDPESITWDFLSDDAIKANAREAFHAAEEVLKERELLEKREHKIIFTDIEGVLNSQKYWEDCIPCPGAQHPHVKLHPLMVGRLKAILDATGAKLVVTSVWRNHHMTEFVNALEELGIPEEDIISKTPMLGQVRHREIKEWLIAHPEVTAFCILDDSLVWNAHDPKFIHVDHAEGLTADDAIRAIEVLSHDRQ